MKLSLRDRWDDITGDQYVEIKIGKYEACCLKRVPDQVHPYVLECYDGNDVYSDIGGADYPLRKLSTLETVEVINFAMEQLGTEAELDRKENERRLA